jgi:hypothetical protein
MQEKKMTGRFRKTNRDMGCVLEKGYEEVWRCAETDEKQSLSLLWAYS